MGWTSYRATYFKKGKVDRKREMDERWTQTEHDSYPELNVLKSAMVGSTYYAAVEIKRNGVREKVFGTVALTSTNWNDGMNFGYKDIDETMGPYQCDCPKGILDLLTPTDSEYALKWRKRCEEKRAQKKDPNTKSNLPVGSVIKFKWHNGEEIVVKKMAPSFQFKRPWWYRVDNHTYVSAKYIPENFEVLERG